MTLEQAKEILLLYRPGTADADDPEFAAALQLVKRSSELCRWLEARTAAYEKIRGQFKRMLPPEGLREQILSERPVNTAVWQRNLSLRQVAVAAALILMVIGGINLTLRLREAYLARRFAAYGAQMVASAQSLYGMSLETNKLQQIRLFFAARQIPSAFVLPPGLEQKTITGCVAQSWREHPVAMVCFRSTAAGPGSDLWLFVTARNSFPNAPANAAPGLVTAGGLPAATWTTNGLTYLVALQGDASALKHIIGIVAD